MTVDAAPPEALQAIWRELAGRESEAALFAAAIARLAEGKGAVVLIESAPGLGKSAVLRAVARNAVRAGCLVLRGRGDERPAFLLPRLLTDSLGAGPGPGPCPGARAGTVLAGVDQMLAVARGLCRGRPVLVALDDLQLAEGASLGLWHGLARLASEAPLLLVGAATTMFGPRLAASLRDKAPVGQHPDAAVVRLGPLDPDTIARLVASRALSAECGPRLRSELARAGGNPRYAIELATALRNNGLLTAADGKAEFTGTPGVMPPGLGSEIVRRLSWLGGDVTAVLRLAAVLGDRFPAAELVAVADRPAGVTRNLVARAVMAGVLAREDGRVQFRQDVVRDALLSQTPAVVAGMLHLHIAQVLAARGAVGPVARHLARGPWVPSDWIMRWLAGRWETALSEEPQATIGLLEAALGSIDEGDPRWAETAERLIRARFLQCHDDGVAELASDISARAAGTGLAARAGLYLARSALRAGRYRDGIDAARTALAAGGLSCPWRGRLRGCLAVLLCLSGQVAEGEGIARAMLDADSVCQADAGRAWARWAMALASATETALGQVAVALAVAPEDEADLRVPLLAFRSVLLGRLDRPDEAERALRGALREGERTGCGGAALAAAARACYLRGQWDQALARLRSLGSQAEQDDSCAHGLAMLIAQHRGEPLPPAAGRPVAPATALPGPRHLTLARALGEEARGNPAAAVDAAGEWLDAAGACGDCDAEGMPALVRVALAAGEHGTARRLVAAAQSAFAADPVPARARIARFCQAQLTGDAAALADLAAEYRQRRAPLLRGLALEEAAERLARTGDHDAARTALDEAVSVYAGLGAGWDVRRARARLRKYGIRRGQDRPREKKAGETGAPGWTVLTPAEQSVARLVASGLRRTEVAAQLFMSPRTVDTHMTRVLTKLRLRSRAELASALARRPSSCGASSRISERTHLLSASLQSPRAAVSLQVFARYSPPFGARDLELTCHYQ